MTEDAQLLNNWYRYAAEAEGFIGVTLKAHRSKVFMTQEQQRNLLGILDPKYDQFWLQLMAMPQPRASQFEADMQRIVADVKSKTAIEVDINVEQLMELVRAGLEP